MRHVSQLPLLVSFFVVVDVFGGEQLDAESFFFSGVGASRAAHLMKLYVWHLCMHFFFFYALAGSARDVSGCHAENKTQDA